MSDKKITHLLIDTSYLWKFGPGFEHPDFMKLLRCSAIEGTLKIYIPYIVWEERRTQLLDEACSCRRKLAESFETLNKQLATNIILRGLAPPVLNIWSEADIDTQSKQVMSDFATKNKIEIVSLAPDHADRAWHRYFNVHPPFNREEKRENRRKDIPDSWILEAAIDIVNKHRELLALAPDGKLSEALESIGVQVFNDSQKILDVIYRTPHKKSETETLHDHEAAVAPEEAIHAMTGGELEVMLAGARDEFKDIDTKILGYVGYLETPSKEQLFDLLLQSGISIGIAKNAVERLALTGMIRDIGHHYLPGNKRVSDLAATLIESEIIELLGRE